MSPPHELKRVTTDNAGLVAVSTLLRETWPVHDRFVPRMLQWLYADNPAGRVVGFDAWSGGSLAAHYAGVPVTAVVRGEVRHGLLSVNTVTHPRHQGAGLFTRLAERTFAAAADEGFSFVVGVANANSIQGFIRKLGFALVARLDVQIGIGELRESGTPKPDGFRRLWTPELLAWRSRSPGTRYSRRRNLLLSTTRYPMIQAVLARLERSAPAIESLPRSAVLPRVWLGLDPGLSWRGSAYVPLPERLRPSPLNLIFKSLDGSAGTIEKADVRFEAIDFDAF